MVWVPLVIVSLVSLGQGRVGYRWTAGFGLTIAMFFYLGFTAYWIYGMLFVGVTSLIWLASRHLPIGRVFWLAAAGLLGVALSAPLMIMQLDMAAGIVRPSLGTTGITLGLTAMLAPYPLTNAPHPENSGATRADFISMSPMYYAGTLFSPWSSWPW